MSGINQICATAIPLTKANVDTDQLLPKQFLTGVTRMGYGKHLFHDWRYIDPEGKRENPDFVLNRAEFKGAEILLAGENFGCGSSREHAPWALADFGFKVIIADLITMLPNTKVDIDLLKQTVTTGKHSEAFEIESHHKTNLMSGLDSIAQSLLMKHDIEIYENRIPQWQK